MPQDTRRNCYQETSYHPDRFQDSNQSIESSLVNDNGLRGDKRQANDPRPTFMETGIITRSKGSSYVEIGRTKIICGCYGPRQLQSKDASFSRGMLMCEMTYANFASAVHKTNLSSVVENEMSSFIVDALSPCVMLDRFPKAQVDIYITVLEDDGSVLAAAITAASLALADARIEMYTLAIGASLKQFGELTLLDPTADEENRRADIGVDVGHLTLAYMVDLSQISMLSQKGHMGHQQLTQGMMTLVDICKEVYPLMRRCLLDSVEKKC